MTERQEDELWDRGREEDDFPRPSRGYCDEGQGAAEDPEPEPPTGGLEEAEQ